MVSLHKNPPSSKQIILVSPLLQFMIKKFYQTNLNCIEFGLLCLFQYMVFACAKLLISTTKNIIVALLSTSTGPTGPSCTPSKLPLIT